MRSDIINEVLSVEDRAQQVIRDAERTARDYISDAQTKANEYVRSTLKEERERLQAMLTKAEQDAQQQLEAYEAGLNISSNLQDSELEAIVTTIVQQVCKTDLESYMEVQ